MDFDEVWACTQRQESRIRQANYGFESLDEQNLHRWESKGDALFGSFHCKANVPKEYNEAGVIYKPIIERHEVKSGPFREAIVSHSTSLL